MQFLEMVQKEANAADSMSSWLNAFQIVLLFAVAAATFAATISTSLQLWATWQRAIVTAVPGLATALLAIINPRVDWHRMKEIELNAIYSAVKYERIPVEVASERYWEARRSLEVGWQKAQAVPPPVPSANPRAQAPDATDATDATDAAAPSAARPASASSPETDAAAASAKN